MVKEIYVKNICRHVKLFLDTTLNFDIIPLNKKSRRV